MNAQLTSTTASSLAETTIRVARVPRYGPPKVIVLGRAPRPALRPGTVRIVVEATTVTIGDARIRGARLPRGFGAVLRLAFGWSGPRQQVLGTELTGIVTDVGDGVTAFRAGDAVIAVTGTKLGAHAEEVVLPADGLIVPRPSGLDVKAAAAIAFGGLTASHYLDRCEVKPGERVLVVGASGAVGLAVVQLAKRRGAVVTGVCSAENAALVERMGAAHTIDYRAQDPFADSADSPQWDVIVDAAGTAPYSVCRRRLAPGGRLARVLCDLPGLLLAPLQGRLSGHRVIAGVTVERKEALLDLCALAARGDYEVVIDSVYSMDAIAEAHARVDSGRKRGNVVVLVG